MTVIKKENPTVESEELLRGTVLRRIFALAPPN
jgi:hypothetical protein